MLTILQRITQWFAKEIIPSGLINVGLLLMLLMALSDIFKDILYIEVGWCIDGLGHSRFR